MKEEYVQKRLGARNSRHGTDILMTSFATVTGRGTIIAEKLSLTKRNSVLVKSSPQISPFPVNI